MLMRELPNLYPILYPMSESNIDDVEKFRDGLPYYEIPSNI